MKNYWNWALGISIGVHTFILSGLPRFLSGQAPQIRKSEKANDIQIIAQDTRRLEKERDAREINPPPPYLDNFIKKKLITRNDKVSSLEQSKIFEKNLKGVFHSKSVEKKIEELPAYMDYYRLIREKIRSNAYRYYRSKNKGEVSLNFVILNNGELESITLDEKSANSPVLREVALKSIKDAAPFPAFPKELSGHQRLQFNLYIYFSSGDTILN